MYERKKNDYSRVNFTSSSSYKKPKKLGFFSAVALFGVISLVGWQLSGWYFADNAQAASGAHASGDKNIGELVLQPVMEAQAVPDAELSRVSGRLRSGEGLSAVLKRHGLTSQESHAMCSALRKEVDLRKLQPGAAYVFEKQVKTNGITGQVNMHAFELVITDTFGVPKRYRAQKQNGALDYDVSYTETPVETVKWGLSGTITSNLYDAVVKAGGDPGLVNRFADIFAWQIDFYSEARKTDSFKMLAEKRFADGRFIGYGKVLAAEYVVNGRTLRGFRFESADGNFIGIFDENGKSLEKTFLRSPVELARITSTFGQRFHPILKRQKKHNGVDYGAPRGTPFWSIADGEVIEAGFNRYNGNWVRIAHRFGFITEYLHASRLAPGLKKGQKVRQRQVVGYVGATGLASGPHLHFGMKRYDKYVNPAVQKFPTGQEVEPRLRDAFKLYIRPLVNELAGLSKENHDARIG